MKGKEDKYEYEEKKRKKYRNKVMKKNEESFQNMIKT
jgi:hypothetical protein